MQKRSVGTGMEEEGKRKREARDLITIVCQNLIGVLPKHRARWDEQLLLPKPNKYYHISFFQGNNCTSYYRRLPGAEFTRPQHAHKLFTQTATYFRQHITNNFLIGL